jgi:hypothetical protein
MGLIEVIEQFIDRSVNKRFIVFDQAFSEESFHGCAALSVRFCVDGAES